MPSFANSNTQKIRRPAVAGYFYPSDRLTLSNQLERFFASVPDLPQEQPPRALIVPHAGYDYSGLTAAHGYTLLRRFPDRWRRVILIGPAHTVLLRDVVGDPHPYWKSPLGIVDVISGHFPVSEAAHRREHALEVQLPFLQYTLDEFQLLPLLAGQVDPAKYVDPVLEALTGNTLLLISSDLSHFHDHHTAALLDRNTCDAIEQLDYEKMEREGDACGKVPILIAIAIARRLGWQCRLLHYRHSGESSGDLDRVVGYATFGFF